MLKLITTLNFGKISWELKKLNFQCTYILNQGPSVDFFNFHIFWQHFHQKFMGKWFFCRQFKSNLGPLLERWNWNGDGATQRQAACAFDFNMTLCLIQSCGISAYEHNFFMTCFSQVITHLWPEAETPIYLSSQSSPCQLCQLWQYLPQLPF